jgi:hypothetical protein
MIKASISLQDLRRKMYLKAKSEKTWRFWGYLKDWVEKKVRRHLMRARKLCGFGWDRWSRVWLYKTLGLYNDYRVKYYGA